jgi:hypothetical protein
MTMLANFGEKKMKNNMTKHSIYCSDESRPLEEALKIITDEWVDDGNYCAQTVIDMRDALKKCLNEIENLKLLIDTDYWPHA